MNTEVSSTRQTSPSTAGTIFSALRFVAFLMIVGFSFASPVLAQKKASATPPDAPPPLLDRELFFGDPEIVAAQLSPDGQYIAFLKPYKGSRNIWVKKTAESFDKAKLITADMKRPISEYFWSRDGKYILFVQDKAGDENYNVYAVNPADSPPAGEEVPAARNLTDAKGARAIIYNVPRSEPDFIYVGLNDRDASWHDLYKVKISTGERTLIQKNTERIAGWVFDVQDKLRLASRVAENGDNELLRIGEKSFTKIYSCSVLETCNPVRFNKDNRRVYMDTNKGDSIDLSRLVLFDIESGKEELVESDPQKRVDFGGASFSNVSNEIIATTYEDERTRVYFKDKAYESDYNLLKSKLPGKEINFGSSTRDEQLFLISANSDRDPGASYLFDRKTKDLTLQYRIYEKIPREQLSPMQAITYKSSDGLVVPAFLTLPKGVAAKNLPLVVFPHGGPWYRDSWGYNPISQFLANRGYAVLQPNFRGSTGYGKKFLNAGNNEWGQKMQDDITWGVKHLVAQGIADAKRVGIMGGSYGGYATLAGVAFTPDVYAVGVSIVGPSNLITLLDSIPPYWEFIRNIFYVRMGNPSTPEGKAQLERQSPLNSATKITAPLLVIQGANDPRVNKAESDQIVIALRDRGFPVEYLVAPDEGHGFARPVNNLAMFAASEKFLAKYLKGRYQEEMPSETAQRLNEITVNVKSVKLAKKIDASTVGVPKPVTELQAGTVNYKGSLAMGERSIPVTVSREIKEEGGAWVATETAMIAGQNIKDEAVIEKGTLLLKRRAIKQGPVEIVMDVKGNTVTGTMAMGSQPKPINVDAGGKLFADGAGANDVIAALPLAEGYTTTFRNLDVNKQKPSLKQLKVVGAESVTVAAGTFAAYKVELTSAEGEPGTTTLWVAKDSRKVVKISAVMPQANGAVMTVEMEK
ncbi:MAG TPA: alpha/beta fold hydrolase [Blastocatellia bacterium]|nr:alpha/beta fold hydrolase [Blastocatellia bacterium]